MAGPTAMPSPTDDLVNSAALCGTGRVDPAGALAAFGQPAVRIEGVAPRLGASMRTSDGRWVRLHSGRDPIREADRLIAAAFAHGEPDSVVCVGLGLGYVLDAIERRSRRTTVVAIEPLAATLPAFRERRGWDEWFTTGRLILLVGPAYDGTDAARAAIEGSGASERDPAVIVNPVLARECPRLVGEAEWLVARLLSRDSPGETGPDASASAAGTRSSQSQGAGPDPGTTTEAFLASLERPIALVGNAEVRYPFGERIDSYPTVIRFNNYRIRGFEDRVGRRTTCRCVNAWTDIEHRNEVVEFTPFTAAARESGNLEQYNRENARAVISAGSDVKPLLTETPNPSTGLALIQMLQALQIPADLFAFDGFRSGHYWTRGQIWTTHSRTELDYILARGDFVLFGDVVDYSGLYSASERWAEPRARRSLLADRVRRLRGQKLLEIRAGGAGLTPQLEEQGNTVTVVELADVNGARDAGATVGLPGLATLAAQYGCVVVGDVLPHLVPNDLTLLLREARRLAPRLLASIPAPSDPRPASWWTALLARDFDVSWRMAAGELFLEGAAARR